ncbi:MAG: peptidylprolyl isomerase [Anaerolineaceae bacterium]|nr:peptidylprolyl isomerase [Anaerolineaceae bacterium]
MKKLHRLLSSCIILIFFITGCNQTQSTLTPDNTIGTPEITKGTETVTGPISTQTVEPTPPEPLVASVNDEGIWLSDYEADVQRYLDAAANLVKEVDENQAKELVLDTMIETILLAQGARESGFVLDQEMFTKKMEQLIIDSGGENQFQQWLNQNNYSQVSFERIYRQQIEAVWMRDQIISQVPTRAEQIRARQVLVSSKALADSIFNELENGAEFDYYSWGYDQLSGGELGWFPRDYLILPEIEAAVFDLKPGEYTDVIQSTYGFHIVQVMERDLDRNLTQDALLQKQRIALESWLTEKKANSTIILK